MLKLKFQYFGHLMQRTDSLEKTLTLEKTEGRRRRGQQKMRWLDGITDSMDMSLMDSDMLLNNARITKVSKIDNIKCWWGCRATVLQFIFFLETTRTRWLSETLWACMMVLSLHCCLEKQLKKKTAIVFWCITTLGNNLAVSYIIKYTATVWLSNSTPRCMTQRNEKLCRHKNLYRNVHSSFTNNHSEPDTVQILITSKMDK